METDAVFNHFIKHLIIQYGGLFTHQFKGSCTLEYAMRVYHKDLGNMEPEEAARILDHLKKRDDKYPPNLMELIQIRRMLQPREESPLLECLPPTEEDRERGLAFIKQLRERLNRSQG